MFERLTERARHVLVQARQEAEQLGHGRIGSEHLLLGLIREHDGTAAQVLGDLGITFDDVRDRVERSVGLAAGEPSRSPPFTPRAKRILDLSLRSAMQLGHDRIGTEDLLLGIVDEGHGVGARILQDLGVELPRVRQAVIRNLSVDQAGASLGGRPVGSEPKRSPRCARCSSAIEPLLRYRSVTIRPSSPSTHPRQADIVFCDNCGHVVGVLTSDSAG